MLVVVFTVALIVVNWRKNDIKRQSRADARKQREVSSRVDVRPSRDFSPNLKQDLSGLSVFFLDN